MVMMMMMMTVTLSRQAGTLLVPWLDTVEAQQGDDDYIWQHCTVVAL